MKKFQFRLQKVLQHRQILEQLAQADHMQAMSELNAEVQRLEELKEQKHGFFQRRFESQTRGGTNIAELSHIDLCIQGHDLRIKLQTQKVQEKEKLVEEKRQILSKAAQEVKIIEKLKEREKEAFMADFLKHEQAEADEHSVLRFGRKMKDVE